MMLLDFEKPLVELENRISDLKNYTGEKGIDLGAEIEILEKRALDLKKEIYQNLTPWQRTQLARHPERPNTLDYIKMLFTDWLPLSGDRLVGDDPAVIGGIGRFEGIPVTVIGQVKGHNTKENLARNFGMAHPEGFRKSLRLVQQAAKFHRPVISFIDTPGAHSGIDAEEGGQAWAIAGNLRAFAQIKTPIISVITGEGGSGGALAMVAGDALLMLENAVFSVVSPEGCAAILWKDASRASEAANAMKITASELLRLGLIDGIVTEPLGGAHREPNVAVASVGRAIQAALDPLVGLEAAALIARRREKFLAMGRDAG